MPFESLGKSRHKTFFIKLNSIWNRADADFQIQSAIYFWIS